MVKLFKLCVRVSAITSLVIAAFFLNRQIAKGAKISFAWLDGTNDQDSFIERQVVKDIMNLQREIILKEFDEYEFYNNTMTLDDLIPKRGGNPVRTVLFSTYRSGSSFLGAILSSHPGTYYHYEPLLPFGESDCRSNVDFKCTDFLENILNCNITNEHEAARLRNTQILQYCEIDLKLCANTKFLSAMCNLFPFQSVKIDRMKLKSAKQLLENKKLNVRILFLVRDPRGTMHSRRNLEWCKSMPTCNSPAFLCSELEENFYAAQELRKLFPDRFIAIRYEDLALAVYSEVKRIFRFLKMDYTQQTETFLYRHTAQNTGDAYSTYRNSKTTPLKWLKALEVGLPNSVINIELHCQEAMKLWGYRLVNSSDVNENGVIGPPPWDEMQVDIPSER